MQVKRNHKIRATKLQALKAGISFSPLLEQKAFSGVLESSYAYLPKFQTVLIAEPEKNRIGIYNARTFNFLSWVMHPDITKRTMFQFPNIFVLKNGHILILEDHQLNILNENFVPLQKAIPGKFVGLSEESSISISAIKLTESKSDELFSKKLVLIGEGYCCVANK